MIEIGRSVRSREEGAFESQESCFSSAFVHTSKTRGVNTHLGCVQTELSSSKNEKKLHQVAYHFPNQPNSNCQLKINIHEISVNMLHSIGNTYHCGFSVRASGIRV